MAATVKSNMSFKIEQEEQRVMIGLSTDSDLDDGFGLLLAKLNPHSEVFRTSNVAEKDAKF
jgi:hypothetical protein